MDDSRTKDMGRDPIIITYPILFSIYKQPFFPLSPLYFISSDAKKTLSRSKLLDSCPPRQSRTKRIVTEDRLILEDDVEGVLFVCENGDE
jgi:hypothetical protein